VLQRWEEEHARLKELVLTLYNQTKSSPAMAPKYRAMQTRLRKFEEVGPPPPPPTEQNVRVGLKGGRTGVRVANFENIALQGLTDPFNFEIFYGDRVAVLGKNGQRKVSLFADDFRRSHREIHR
jgi:ATPase subunit of ABC transporter with duplicated ATPase domains